MAEIYIINETRQQFAFLDEGYTVNVSWLFKLGGWDAKMDNVFIVNTNGDGISLEPEYIELINKVGVLITRKFGE